MSDEQGNKPNTAVPDGSAGAGTAPEGPAPEAPAGTGDSFVLPAADGSVQTPEAAMEEAALALSKGADEAGHVVTGSDTPGSAPTQSSDTLSIIEGEPDPESEQSSTGGASGARPYTQASFNTDPPPKQESYTYDEADSAQQGKGMAIASMVVGIVAIVLCCCLFFLAPVPLICGIVAVGLGIAALIKNTPAKGMAIAGIITGAIALLLMVGMLIITALAVNDPDMQEMLQQYEQQMDVLESQTD